MSERIRARIRANRPWWLVAWRDWIAPAGIICGLGIACVAVASLAAAAALAGFLWLLLMRCGPALILAGAAVWIAYLVIGGVT